MTSCTVLQVDDPTCVDNYDAADGHTPKATLDIGAKVDATLRLEGEGISLMLSANPERDHRNS